MAWQSLAMDGYALRRHPPHLEKRTERVGPTAPKDLHPWPRVAMNSNLSGTSPARWSEGRPCQPSPPVVPCRALGCRPRCRCHEAQAMHATRSYTIDQGITTGHATVKASANRWLRQEVLGPGERHRASVAPTPLRLNVVVVSGAESAGRR